jgi:hypothetical protein
LIETLFLEAETEIRQLVLIEENYYRYAAARKTKKFNKTNNIIKKRKNGIGITN